MGLLHVVASLRLCADVTARRNEALLPRGRGEEPGTTVPSLGPQPPQDWQLPLSLRLAHDVGSSPKSGRAEPHSAGPTLATKFVGKHPLGAVTSPASTILIPCSRAPLLADFGMKPAAPQTIAFSTTFSLANAETITIGSLGNSRRSSMRPSYPCVSGSQR